MRFIYESTLDILPLYSISLFNLTATFLFKERCNTFNGLLVGCCEEDAAILLINCERTLGYNKKLPLKRFVKFLFLKIIYLITEDIEKLADLMTEFTTHGALVEFAGGRQSGKTLLLHIICSLNSLKNIKTCYVDNVGRFDPQFIFSYLESTKTLNKKEIYFKMKYVSHARAYEIGDLLAIIKKIRIMDYACVVFDDLLMFYSYRHDRNTKEQIRNIVREIAMLALSKRTCIIFTNPIVRSPNNQFPSRSSYEFRYNDIIRYIHFKAIINKEMQDVLSCKFVYPAKLENMRLILVPQANKKYRI